MPFTNVFRWTAAPDGGSIRLEHLRFGAGIPVFLLDLVPIVEGVLESSEPHVCREDRYSARMDDHRRAIRLGWTIRVPKKNETISYLYRFGLRRDQED